MPENKKQHYVPQFYLKLFSKNGNNICNYHLNLKKLNRTPIKEICQGSYFYGTDIEYEKMLSELEQLQAKVIKQIIETQSLNDIETKDYFHLMLFLLLQHSRTKQTKLTMDKAINDLFNQFIIPYTSETQGTDIGSVEVKVDKYHLAAMEAAMKGVELISDLLPVLIVNNTESDFITSDAPIILYNYLKIKDCNLVGFQSPGLQIYCPLNEKLLLLLIHADFYKINHNSELIITLKNASDVDELNKLQFFNCLHSIICSDEEKLLYLVNLHKSIEDKICTNKIKPEYVSKIPQEERSDRRIIKLHRLPTDYNLKLSFLKLNHEGDRVFKSWLKEKIKKNPTINPVRNEDICSNVKKELMKCIKK